MKTLKNIALILAACTLSATSAFGASNQPTTPETDYQPSINAADVNGDGSVGIDDLLEVLKHWGEQTKGANAADIDGDGTVGFGDMLEVLSNYGA